MPNVTVFSLPKPFIKTQHWSWPAKKNSTLTSKQKATWANICNIWCLVRSSRECVSCACTQHTVTTCRAMQMLGPKQIKAWNGVFVERHSHAYVSIWKLVSNSRQLLLHQKSTLLCPCWGSVLRKKQLFQWALAREDGPPWKQLWDGSSQHAGLVQSCFTSPHPFKTSPLRLKASGTHLQALGP